MGILDDIKPRQKKPRPTAWRYEPLRLNVSWDDGRQFGYGARALRVACPCAGCVDEWSGKRTVDESTVKPGLMIQSAEETGRYAVQLTFSDTHATGIYSWDYLHALMETLQAPGQPPA